jgi:hypothetical protein
MASNYHHVQRYIHDDRLAEKTQNIPHHIPNRVYEGTLGYQQHTLRYPNSILSDNSIGSPANSVFQCPAPEEEDEHTVLAGPVV